MKISPVLLPFLFTILACNPHTPSTDLINQQACTVGLTKAPVGGNDTLYIPNIFTPDADGVNDDLRIVLDTIGLSLSGFQLLIENPGGNQVYTSNDLFDRWDGRDSNGEPYKSTLYDYFLDITVNGVAYSFNGQITLIKPSIPYDEEFEIVNCSECRFSDQIDQTQGFILDSRQPLISICQ